jgi:3-phenylpropionate/trans-cinnamate dioxygenase ferredoxin component
VRDGDALFACERACPHEQADLAGGHCSAGKLYCPRHLAWFDLTDGRVFGGWASRPLRIHAVRIEGDQVLVTRRPADQDHG